MAKAAGGASTQGKAGTSPSRVSSLPLYSREHLPCQLGTFLTVCSQEEEVVQGQSEGQSQQRRPTRQSHLRQTLQGSRLIPIRECECSCGAIEDQRESGEEGTARVGG